MKAIALILTASMLLLNTGHLLETLQPPAEISHSGCCEDCSSDCCNPAENPQERDSSCHGDTPCTPGCACSCDIQLSALTYEFMELEGTIFQSCHYGNYLNTYSFEYAEDFLHPPRKV